MTKENIMTQSTDTPIVVEDSNGPPAAIPTKKKGGRPKSSKYLPWAECRQLVRAECLTSKGQFEKWFQANQPRQIPRFPYRVYTAPGEWVSWNEFLGNDNKFNVRIGTKWQTLTEATKYVHTLNLKSFAEWIEFCKTDDLPDNIPKRPELTYSDWISWPNFLGNTPSVRIEAVKETQKTQVYYITHEVGAPENVFSFGVEQLGISGMKDRYSRGNIHIMKMFWYNPEKGALIKQAVESLSTPYMGQSNQRIVPNVYQIIEILQFHLDTIHRP
jgi:hypothetical protein